MRTFKMRHKKSFSLDLVSDQQGPSWRLAWEPTSEFIARRRAIWSRQMLDLNRTGNGKSIEVT